MTADPWVFGWSQLLTIIGFAITTGIAFFGFRSFERWRKEKLEEKRIDLAIEALSLAYEAKYIFQSIRSPMSFPFESQDMPKWENETEAQRNARAPYYAILFRINQHKDFFDRLFKIQPRFMALFGATTEEIFMSCHKARRTIQVSAGMLMRVGQSDEKWNENRQRQRDQWEADVWEGMDDVVENSPEARRVSLEIEKFQEGIITICTPIAERTSGDMKWRLSLTKK
jgi:hypothetical protein